MRATRALLRRRLPLMRKRAEWLTPLQKTKSPYNLPELGKQMAYQANRDGVAERCREPAGHKRIAGALARLAHDDRRRRDMALPLVKTSQPHDAHTLALLRTGPGLGERLPLGLLEEMHDIERFPRGQACVSSCRLGKCAKAAAGHRSGTAGSKIGHASLTWAFSEAAGWFLRAHPVGQQSRTRLEKKHGQGKA
jgi:hypothetical protein